jgi:hypothetical protein
MSTETATPIKATKKSKGTPAGGAPEAASKAKADKETVAQGDKFVRNLDDAGKGVAPTKKLPPQAETIVNLIETAGADGITRKDLVDKMKGTVVTRQPEGRILTYYQKLIQEMGSVKLVKASGAAAAAE